MAARRNPYAPAWMFVLICREPRCHLHLLDLSDWTRTVCGLEVEDRPIASLSCRDKVTCPTCSEAERVGPGALYDRLEP